VEIAAAFEQMRSYSVSCLTDLTSPNGFLTTNPISGALSVSLFVCIVRCVSHDAVCCLGTNDALDQLETVLGFLDAGVLRRGDIFVLDNCRIHKAADTIRMLGLVLDAAGVRMWFLPRYSPEVSVFRCGSL